MRQKADEAKGRSVVLHRVGGIIAMLEADAAQQQMNEEDEENGCEKGVKTLGCVFNEGVEVVGIRCGS